MISIDLSNEILFIDNTINFNDKVTFVYGRNGTGKSSLSKIIKDQLLDREVSVFQGYESILGENKKLNAVILGEKDKLIDSQISELEDEMKSIQAKIVEIKQNTEKPDDGKTNYYTNLQEAKSAYASHDSAFKKKKSEAAARIKNMQPQIAPPTYDVRDFAKDIPLAKELNPENKKHHELMLKSETKTAPDIVFPSFDFFDLLKRANIILVKKVIERTLIDRLENNEDKRKFAEEGMRLHMPGDICAFCGGVVTQQTFDELKSYFSADEVKAFQKEISTFENDLSDIIAEMSTFQINANDFYPEYKARVNELSIKIREERDKIVITLSKIQEAIQKKKANLFTECPSLELDSPPDGLDALNEEYKKLVSENNANDLKDRQTKAKNALRLNEVFNQLKKINYSEELKMLDTLRMKRDSANSILGNETNKISGKGGYNDRINEILVNISKLKEQTQNSEILAKRINDKLRNMVSFELVPIEGEGNIYYSVKSTKTDEIRDISKLSTGEHNIIAFLYFIERLNEIREGEELKDKLIIFDDPMNSNDDQMQYLIINVLQELIRNLEKSNDAIIILTHNKHFYLNVSYAFKPSAQKPFIHLEPCNNTTKIKYISRDKDDFKTSYDALWHELSFLYHTEAVAAEMLLNPIRRIIETYIKFNSINPNDFYVKHGDARKLFNVNSHSIDDLEADLNGLTKDEIITLLKKCFESNSAISHFEKHFLNSSD